MGVCYFFLRVKVICGWSPALYVCSSVVLPTSLRACGFARGRSCGRQGAHGVNTRVSYVDMDLGYNGSCCLKLGMPPTAVGPCFSPAVLSTLVWQFTSMFHLFMLTWGDPFTRVAKRCWSWVERGYPTSVIPAVVVISAMHLMLGEYGLFCIVLNERTRTNLEPLLMAYVLLLL